MAGETHTNLELKVEFDTLSGNTLIKAIKSLRESMERAMGIPFDMFQAAANKVAQELCPESLPPLGPHEYVAHYCVGEWVKVCERCGKMVEG